MARRKSRKRQQADAIEGLLMFCIVGAGLLGYYLTESLTGAAVIAGCVLGLVIAVMIMNRQKRIERLRKSGINDIDKMEGRQFEHYLSHLMKSQGYSVEVTRAAGDYGADLVINKAGKKIVVQAKRYSKNVGIEAVQQVYSSQNYYGASEAWVLCNRDYTEAARNLAKSNGVRLIGREELIDMILKMNPGAVPSPVQVIKENPVDAQACNRCGNPMVVRKGPKGEFFGCSSYPKCRNVKAISS